MGIFLEWGFEAKTEFLLNTASRYLVSVSNSITYAFASSHYLNKLWPSYSSLCCCCDLGSYVDILTFDGEPFHGNFYSVSDILSVLLTQSHSKRQRKYRVTLGVEIISCVKMVWYQIIIAISVYKYTCLWRLPPKISTVCRVITPIFDCEPLFSIQSKYYEVENSTPLMGLEPTTPGIRVLEPLTFGNRISNFIPQFTGNVITYPCWNQT